MQQAGPVGARDPGVDHPVTGEHLHPVAGVAGERGQQQRGIHRGVEARGVADPTGAGARGVEHDDDAAVLLGLPGAHDEVLAPGGGAPVDRAHVVAVDVVAQAVELGALAADAHRGPAVELAQHGESAGQVLARGERVQRPDRPGHLDRPLPRGQPQRPEDAHGHPVGEPVAAPGGHEVGREAHPLVRRHGERRARHRTAPADGGHASRSRPRTPRPEVFVTHRLLVVVSPSRTWVGLAAHDGQHPRAAGEEHVERHEHDHEEQPPPHRRRRAATRRPAPAPAGPARRCAR